MVVRAVFWKVLEENWVNKINMLQITTLTNLYSRKEIRKSLNQRDMKVTGKLIVICLNCYFILVGPMCLTNENSPDLNLFFHILYWVHYSMNFIIYAARNEQFRKAYWYFLKKVTKRFEKCLKHLIYINITYSQMKYKIIGQPKIPITTTTALLCVDNLFMPAVIHSLSEVQKQVQWNHKSMIAVKVRT